MGKSPYDSREKYSFKWGERYELFMYSFLLNKSKNKPCIKTLKKEVDCKYKNQFLVNKLNNITFHKYTFIICLFIILFHLPPSIIIIIIIVIIMWCFFIVLLKHLLNLRILYLFDTIRRR